MSCGDVAVPELRVEDEMLLRPVCIERLIGSIPFIGEEGILFCSRVKGGIHIEGSRLYRVMGL